MAAGIQVRGNTARHHLWHCCFFWDRFCTYLHSAHPRRYGTAVAPSGRRVQPSQDGRKWPQVVPGEV